MSNRYAISFAISLFTALTFVTFGAAGASAAVEVTSVSLQAERLAAVNACPETVDFRGSITMNGRGTVRYTFVRSDGATGPVYSLHFPKGGTKEVSTSWMLGKSYTGYQKLKVISPNDMESSESRFNLRCSGGILGDSPVKIPVLPVSSISVSCPIDTARTEMVTPLSDGWWQTPQLGRLVSVGIQRIGGEQTMVCRYSAYGAQVSVMKRFPEGRNDCRVSGTNRFTCR